MKSSRKTIVRAEFRECQALTRGLALLDLIADSKRPLRFVDIAERRRACEGHGCTGCWRRWWSRGCCRSIRRDQTYRLGVRLFEMAHRVWNEFDLRGAAEPELERLARD